MSFYEFFSMFNCKKHRHFSIIILFPVCYLSLDIFGRIKSKKISKNLLWHERWFLKFIWNFSTRKMKLFVYFFSFWSYFYIWLLYMHVIAHEHSYDIIGQKSSIGQKFLPPRAPLQYQKNEIFCKYLDVFLLNFQASPYVADLRRAEWSKFLTDQWFLDFDAKWCCLVKHSCQNQFYMIFYIQT